MNRLNKIREEINMNRLNKIKRWYQHECIEHNQGREYQFKWVDQIKTKYQYEWVEQN